MKIFNKIAVCTFAATMIVTQAQAIELVKVAPVAKFIITEAAKESLVQSMKLHINEPTNVKAMFNIQKTEVSYLSRSKTQMVAKANVAAE